MSREDDRAAEVYSDPANRELVGPGRRPSPQHKRLERHVPIRFGSEIIDQVKILAEGDGITVSSWIRRLVEDEVTRRMAKEQYTVLASWPTVTTIASRQVPDDESSTANEDGKSNAVNISA